MAGVLLKCKIGRQGLESEQSFVAAGVDLCDIFVNIIKIINYNSHLHDPRASL